MDSEKTKEAECVYLNISALMSCPSKKFYYARIHPTKDVQVEAVVESESIETRASRNQIQPN